MLENLKTRILIIFLSIAVSVYFLVPTLKFYSSNNITSEEMKHLEFGNTLNHPQDPPRTLTRPTASATAVASLAIMRIPLEPDSLPRMY